MSLPHCRLGVNVDHVATLRQARRAVYPDPVTAAALAELGGADQITVHLRQDRRHINDRDLRLLKETCKTALLNLEMAATDEMMAIALELRPDAVTLVPERAEEVTTEGGLNVSAEEGTIRSAVQRLKNAGIIVSIFVDADAKQVRSSREVGADRIEIHTGTYCAAEGAAQARELQRVAEAAALAQELSLEVAAGHGLHYLNVHPIASIPAIEELNIGHALVARAVLVGMERAVREMVERIDRARR